MKKLILILSVSLCFINVKAQSVPPRGITYQAVAIDDKGIQIAGVDAKGVPLPEKEISVQFSIISDSANGSVDYSEVHLTNTDKYGLFTLVIGEGEPLTTFTFGSINWGAGAKYLKVELDINAGNGFKVVSIQQMMSVPYALFSGATGTDFDEQQLGLSGTKGTITLTNGGSVTLADSSATNELQTISVRNDTIFLSNGGFVKMPGGANNWSTLGNSGIVDGTNFLGTIDNKPLSLRVNNLNAGKIDPIIGNSFYGEGSGEWNSSGLGNAAFGKSAMFLTSGNYNTAIGSSALSANIGNNNVALGSNAIKGVGGAIGSNNIAIGFNSLLSNDKGSFNSAGGSGALYSNTNGFSNVAIGANALYKNATRYNLVAVGDSAMYNNTTGLGNVAIGSKALYSNTTGNSNTASGFKALYSNISGYENTATGIGALFSNTTGYHNTANGNAALYYNTSGAQNTAIGNGALLLNTTGSQNVATGFTALQSNTTGSNNTANGYSALGSNTTGSQNAAIGAHALYSNTIGNFNTVSGYLALYKNTTGSYNTASGSGALQNNDSGSYNTASGYLALYKNTKGLANTATGNGALQNNDLGSYNTASGWLAMNNNTTGSWNIASGISALRYNNTGESNTASGTQALFLNNSGSQNAAIGAHALYNNTTGSNNTAIGYGADVSSGALSNATSIGNNAKVNASNKIRLGNTSVTVIEGQVAYSFPSDGRFKNNISENDVKGLEFINLLRPVVYNFDTRKYEEFITKNMPDSLRKKYLNDDFGASTAIRQSGFIAQEVEKAANQVGYNFNGVHKPTNDNDHYSVAYSQFTVPLVKAVQELNTLLTDLKKENELLRKRLELLEKSIPANGGK